MRKKILVTQSSMPEFQEYINEIRDIWDSHWLTNMGEKHQRLQKELTDFLGVDNIELFTNGHMALEMSLQALGLRGEVITTPFTFASTTHAIVRNGLTPVFCDINADDYTIDVSMIEKLITPRTSAIMPVHVYGNICDIEAIEAIAHEHNLKVIYDAAHTFGELYKGKGIGEFGDISCFSFHATKVFNTIEGGAACFHDKKIGEKLYQLKNFGIKDPETVDGVGANAKMNEFCAAMGLCNLRHVNEEIEKRQYVTAHYRERLQDIAGIKLSPVQKNVKSNYAYFPIIIEPEKFGASRDEIFEKLAKENICTRKYFYPITSSFECYAGKFDPEDTPVALDISRKVLTLPLYSDLEMEIVDEICDSILE